MQFRSQFKGKQSTGKQFQSPAKQGQKLLIWTSVRHL